MNSKERVKSVFNHCEPDRVPLWYGCSPEFWDKCKRETGIVEDEALRQRLGDDFRRVNAIYKGPVQKLHGDATMATVFGIERHGIGYGQPTSLPLEHAETVEDIHDYAWPDPDCMDIGNVRKDADSYDGEYAILGGDWSPFWHDAIDLLGMENLYIKMYDNPELVDALFKHIVDFYAEVNRRTFEAAADVIDIFFIGNDFGSQTGPLLGEPLFRRFILPHLKRLVELGHRYGLKVQLHCCGGVEPLLPSMIEVGLDAFHAVQPSCRGMNLQSLKKKFGADIVFNGAIDSHHVLIDGTPELVREKTREVLDVMMPGGGYVAGASHDYILEETPVENILAMAETVTEYGRYDG